MNRPHKPRKDLTEWAKERQDLIRGVSGGFLFGIPLIYTMEVWWIGSYISPKIILLILVITYVIVVFFNRIEGFRLQSPDNFLDAIMEGVEALAIGLFCSTFMLILLQRITLDTPLEEIMGKIVLDSVPFAFGVALARLILSPESGDENSSSQQGEKQQRQNRSKTPRKFNEISLRETLADINATIIGAIILAFNIAPTDEIPTLAAATSSPWLLAIVAVSLFISYIIVFAAGFTNQEKRRRQRGLFQNPINETIISYLVSLLASFLMLWFFQQFTFDDPWFLWVRYTLILGLPATIGGAAGRLAV